MTRRIYLDGNSLGPPAPGADEVVARFVREEWQTHLIGGWNDAGGPGGWWELPVRVGDRVARLLGAAPGQVVVGDSTTVMWFKAVGASLRLRPERRLIVTQGGGFPTNRHVLDALASASDLVVVAVGPGELAGAVDQHTAVLAVTHVDYRTGRRLDLAALTAAAHAMGALTVWDLSHSSGAMDLHLDRDGADLAVGCTYKYLNGGPGSPAFAYVAARHLPVVDQPIPGWVGHADPFSMSEVHRPAVGIRRLLSGTPPVLGLVALDHALHRFDGIDMADLRAASLARTDQLIAGVEALGLEAVAPRAHAERGSQVSIRFEHAWELGRALDARGVIGDVRPPDLVRFGVAPLSITEADVDEALTRLAGVLEAESWRQWLGADRPTVT